MRSTSIRTNPGRKIQRKNWLEKGVVAHFKVIREREREVLRDDHCNLYFAPKKKREHSSVGRGRGGPWQKILFWFDFLYVVAPPFFY